MKKLTLWSIPALALTTFLAACSGGSNNTGTDQSQAIDSTAQEITYAINTDNSSQVEWRGVMFGVKSHRGTLSFKEGELMVKGGQVTGGNFTVDMNTMAPLDSNYNEEYTKSKLVGHLSSPDFFDVANFPTATYKINSVKGNMASGTLTVRGKSFEEALKDIQVTENEGTVTATGTLTFDRQKYGVTYSTGSADNVISDDIDLKIKITGKAK